MLMRTDPFRDFDRLAQQVLGTTIGGTGTWSKPAAMPMDAYRAGEEFVACLDLPGVDPDAIELDVERNVLTVKAERRPLPACNDIQMQITELFSRQLFLGDTLDTDGAIGDLSAERRGYSSFRQSDAECRSGWSRQAESWSGSCHSGECVPLARTCGKGLGRCRRPGSRLPGRDRGQQLRHRLAVSSGDHLVADGSGGERESSRGHGGA